AAARRSPLGGRAGRRSRDVLRSPVGFGFLVGGDPRARPGGALEGGARTRGQGRGGRHEAAFPPPAGRGARSASSYRGGSRSPLSGDRRLSVARAGGSHGASRAGGAGGRASRSEEHTSELQSRE